MEFLTDDRKGGNLKTLFARTTESKVRNPAKSLNITLSDTPILRRSKTWYEARYIEACGYHHLAVNNQLYFDRLSILMLPNGSRNICWFYLWRHIWMCPILMHSGDVGAFQRLHKRDPVHRN